MALADWLDTQAGKAGNWMRTGSNAADLGTFLRYAGSVMNRRPDEQLLQNYMLSKQMMAQQNAARDLIAQSFGQGALPTQIARTPPPMPAIQARLGDPRGEYTVSDQVDAPSAPIVPPRPQAAGMSQLRLAKILQHPGVSPEVKQLALSRYQAGLPPTEKEQLALEVQRAQLAKAKVETDIATLKLNAKPVSSFKDVQSLRKEWTALSSDYRDVRDSFQRIEQVSASYEGLGFEEMGARDLALIFNYMKMLDPGSVVRESEFALAERSGGAIEWLKAMSQRIETGERLTDAQRADLYNNAKKLMAGSDAIYAQEKETFEKIADAYAMDRKLAVPGFEYRGGVATSQQYETPLYRQGVSQEGDIATGRIDTAQVPVEDAPPVPEGETERGVWAQSLSVGQIKSLTMPEISSISDAALGEMSNEQLDALKFRIRQLGSAQ